MIMRLSELIRNYRSENNISQREFAKRCGLSNSYISFIENEMNPKTGRPIVPNIEQYKKIANAMCISLHKLFLKLDNDSPVVLPMSEEEIAAEIGPRSNDYDLEEFRLVKAYRNANNQARKYALLILEDGTKSK